MCDLVFKMFATLEKGMVGKRNWKSLMMLKCLIEQALLDSLPFLCSIVLMWLGEKRMSFNEELGERGEIIFIFSSKIIYAFL